MKDKLIGLLVGVIVTLAGYSLAVHAATPEGHAPAGIGKLWEPSK